MKLQRRLNITLTIVVTIGFALLGAFVFRISYLRTFETLTPATEPSYENTEEVTQDYTLYEKIVSSLNLTENMRIALECRVKGLSYPEIGRVLSRAQSTVYEYFIKIRQRYMEIYG